MKKNLLITILANLIVTSGLLVGFSVFALSPVKYKSYPDVPKGMYYTDAISHMSLLKIINGYENGNFGPDDLLSRGQIAVILERYNDYVDGQFGDWSSSVDDKLGGSYAKILAARYGLEYVCPAKKLSCDDSSKDSVSCGDDDYVQWVEDNCTVVPAI